MFERDPSDFLQIPSGQPPQLIVAIDTEAEFDWNGPYSRENNCVESISELHHAQEIFDRHGIVPTYLVDYAVASDDQAVRILRDFKESGRCEIGAHLNPWLTPPFEEPVNILNSYPCNLPPELERQKLDQLTVTIRQRFGVRPEVYRAGRFGIRPLTAQIIEDLGYTVDLSIVPFANFAGGGGPDFHDFDYRPYWFGTARRLLEIPVTCGFSGRLACRGGRIFRTASSSTGMFLHLPGILARLRMLERIRLTPEGTSFTELCRLTDSLLAQGCRVFSFTFHSPSLAPGKTPYVRDQNSAGEFLQLIGRYMEYFRDMHGGQFCTAKGLRDEHCPIS